MKKFLIFLSVRQAALILCLLIINGCAITEKRDTEAPIQSSKTIALKKPSGGEKIRQKAATTKNGQLFMLVDQIWDDLPEWNRDKLSEAWPAFLHSCAALQKKDPWKNICKKTKSIKKVTSLGVREFFQAHFKPYKVVNSSENARSLITGYYEPLLLGNKIKTGRFKYPLLGVPDKLKSWEKGSSSKYFPREKIEKNFKSLNIPVIFWVDNLIDLFFLQIQGSGRIQLPSGKIIKVGFGGHNGYAYTSIGKLLIKQGEITSHRASMQGIKQWALENPAKVNGLLDENQRYVFFRVIDDTHDGPVGALNVPLTPQRSIAIDPQIIPLGFPVYLSTTWPNSQKPLHRLMLAQDTGSAIKGPLRGDFFWGFGNVSGQFAGKMKQKGQMWLLLPND